MPGDCCIYYAFAQDLSNPDNFHLPEGWANEEAYQRHEHSESFLKALATVVKNVRIWTGRAFVTM
ncbi:antibiotic biosynthesis monooxygenase [Pseudomonas sp. NPDC008258]|uniref:putative quinol monooxygenase n=1 Tax=Pseudomonas sp. NPDC008258 TaxID=3364418 RepID=UPI0036E2F7D5